MRAGRYHTIFKIQTRNKNKRKRITDFRNSNQTRKAVETKPNSRCHTYFKKKNRNSNQNRKAVKPRPDSRYHINFKTKNGFSKLESESKRRQHCEIVATTLTSAFSKNRAKIEKGVFETRIRIEKQSRLSEIVATTQLQETIPAPLA